MINRNSDFEIAMNQIFHRYRISIRRYGYKLFHKIQIISVSIMEFFYDCCKKDIEIFSIVVVDKIKQVQFYDISYGCLKSDSIDLLEKTL